MSMTEQKFDSLCTLALKNDLGIDMSIGPGKNFSILIYKGGECVDESHSHNSVDQALTDALRHLRKIKTKQ